MRIAIISSQDINSGAGKAAFRLTEALSKYDQDNIFVNMIVRSRFTTNSIVIGPKKRFLKIVSLILPYLDFIIFNLFNRKRRGVYSTSLFGSLFVINEIKKFKPDIVHLHWVNAGTLNLRQVKKINSKVFWSMHDEWLYTGACHVANGCSKYKYFCNTCPELKSNFKYDLSYWLHFRKKLYFNNSIFRKITIIGLSNWITDRAKSSKMLAYNEILQMPNCIDVNLFKPLDKTFARNFYNIPLDKHVIMFGAVNATSDKNKGFDLLLNSISNFNESKSICLIVLGATEKFHISNFNGLVIPISHRYDEESLVMLYNCADVVVVPSRQENFSNTILESLSCGIPVVAFNAGGNSDLIIHKKSGYLANANDSFDLFNGITYVLNHNFKNDISKQARDFVFNNFSYEIIAEKYINLYKKYL